VAVRSFVVSTPLAVYLTPSHLIAIWQRPCPINISLKVSERDKHNMNKTYQSAWLEQGEDETTCWDELDPSEKLPPLKHSETDTDGWEDFNVPALYFYGGLMPYVSRYVSPLLEGSRSLMLTFYQGPASVAIGPTKRGLDRCRDPRNGSHDSLGGSDGHSSSWRPVLVQNGEPVTFLEPSGPILTNFSLPFSSGHRPDRSLLSFCSHFVSAATHVQSPRVPCQDPRYRHPLNRR